MDKFINNLKRGFGLAVTEAEKLTKVVADKTSTMVDVTKLKLTLNETERKTDKLYEKIGELVYAKHKSGTEFDGELGSICSEIDTLKEEITNLNEQIAALKNTVVCPSCDQANDKANEYCSKCGEKLSSEKVTSEDNMVIEVTEFPED